MGKNRNKGDKTLLQTPFGTLRLAKNVAKRFRKTVMELQRTTDSLTRKDIGDWRMAWQMAINVENPNRQRLYDIYRDVEIDLHLAGCIRQREGFVMARSFKLVNGKGEEDQKAAEWFNTEWFKQLMKFALDANYWGHSLIELGDVTTDTNGRKCYEWARLVPRKHVSPEYGRVVEQLGDDWEKGVDYRSPEIAQWLIEVGQPDNLGLFLKAATQTIPKKNALAFWDTFAEIFGMPMRIARTTSRDGKELAKMEKMMADMGTEGWAIFQQGTEIEVVESSKGDAFNVYDRRIDRANSELSKLIIGQTMTIEDGSSMSQSETHLEVFQNLVEADCDMIRDMVNNQLIPRMIKHGFPIKGIHFEWDYGIDYTPEQQVAYEQLVLDNYEVDPAYFQEKYNMPVGERRQQVPVIGSTPPDDGGEETKGNKKQHTAKPQPFFD
ncbi:DUF935 family protein [Prevotella sp. OH937_COT-195]|uniref:phage portal protein family protein n=1 Tax=Prevotella sp. OH937_COT-195 TaxID=2491051 RepID=UPI000F655018|nr:DUF935 family protein [Prevotella sp. OH937_COT-195]RRC97474.1 DUF935 family protein [Prevotella sp. OH937_COT-195]